MHHFSDRLEQPETLQARAAWAVSGNAAPGALLDRGARACGHRPLSDPHGVMTCSHGHQPSLLSVGRYPYFEVIRKRLRGVPGKHLHIGALPGPVVAQFRQNLAAEHIDPSRFELQQPVHGLWAALRESRIDVMLSPTPVPGFEGLVETMGAGIPVLMHASALSNMAASPELVYPEVLRWRTPEELIEVLRGLDAPMLQAHATAARSHYEIWHRPCDLSAAVNTAMRRALLPPAWPFSAEAWAPHGH